jgi:hypothetical protein
MQHVGSVLCRCSWDDVAGLHDVQDSSKGTHSIAGMMSIDHNLLRMHSLLAGL